MIRTDDIQALHWQPALFKPGEIVTDLDDISQCFRLILTTPKGSDPHRPLFGSDLYKYLDNPVPEVVPLIIRETAGALALWEPRAVIESVVPQIEASHLTLRVVWHPIDGVVSITSSVTL